ncbi:MAG TPA: biotin/lipoyl-containing protein, partial [Lautropia sp.]|nr:biotin/lipoyl-containing protein [Lautropia sp.]
MAVEIRVPPLGESLVDAVVGVWLKQEGDSVSRGESLVELETDKVNLDVTAEDDGILSSISRQAGEVVTVGEILGLVSSSNGASAPAPASSAAPASEPAPAPVAPPSPAPVAAAAPPAPAPAVVAPPAEGDSGGRAAPAVRRLAEEHHIDLNTIAGTGPGGRVTREDILIVAARQAVQQGTPQASQPVAAPASAPAPTAHSP